MQFCSLRDHPTYCRGHVLQFRKLLLLGKDGKNTINTPVSSGFDQQGVHISWADMLLVFIPLSLLVAVLKAVSTVSMQCQGEYKA